MEQTNRTILFEEVNPNKRNLLELIHVEDHKKSLTDEEISDINAQLIVASFEEFVDKFAPSVFMLLDTTNCKVTFSTEAIGKEILLNRDNPLFSIFLTMIEEKEKQKNIFLNFNGLLETMVQDDALNQFVESRNHLFQCVGKSEELLKKEWAEFIEKYDDGILLLNLYIKEVYALFSNEKRSVRQEKEVVDDGNMQIRTVCTVAKYPASIVPERIVQDTLLQLLKESRICNDALLWRCILLPSLMEEKNFEEIGMWYESYYDLLKKIVKDFWSAMQPLMQTMLGVRTFFRQYENHNGMKPLLLISNIAIEDTVNHKNREKLEIYLNTVNATSYMSNVIWYAILPNVSSKRVDATHIRERFAGHLEKKEKACAHVEETTDLLNLLGTYKIQCFVNFEHSREYSFAEFQANGIEKMNQILDEFQGVSQKDYFVPCYPNFTVFPEECTYFVARKRLSYDEIRESVQLQKEERVWLDSIGIGAAYVAAGIFAACQCVEYLQEKYKAAVNVKVPGVSYRICEENHNHITATTMPGEVTAVPREHLQEAIRKSRGVLFGQEKGKMILLTDRTFAYSEHNPLLVSMVQTVSYMERMIRFATQDYKKNLLVEFFQRRPGGIISSWYANDSATINAILKDGERLEYQLDDSEDKCTFHIYFLKNNLVIDDTVMLFKE